MKRITTLNLPDFHRSVLGLDRLLDDLTNLNAVNNAGYPPYNIEKTGDNKYQITLAVAGFKQTDIEININEGNLLIEGKKAEVEDEGTEWIHRGIANRSFVRSFKLADYVEVIDAFMEDGMLHVDLERIVPEALLPKRINIR
jgi:molecular chaperone IbpA